MENEWITFLSQLRIWKTGTFLKEKKFSALLQRDFTVDFQALQRFYRTPTQTLAGGIKTVACCFSPSLKCSGFLPRLWLACFLFSLPPNVSWPPEEKMCILCYFKSKVGQRSWSNKLGFLFYYVLGCAEGTLHFQRCFFSQRFYLRGDRFSTSLEHTALKGGVNKASAAWKSITWGFVSHPLKMLLDCLCPNRTYLIRTGV